jgi:hypothetical protein
MPIWILRVVITMYMTRNGRWLFSAALFMAILMAGCVGENVSDEGRYSNSEMSFSIEFHPGWEIIEGDGYEYALVEAVSPWDGEDDMFAEHVSVDVEDLRGDTDLDAYHTETVEAQAEAIPGFYVEEEGRTTIGGVAARYVVFGFESEGYPMTAIGYTLIKDGKGYLIAGLAEAHTFVLYKDVFQQTAASFRID